MCGRVPQVANRDAIYREYQFKDFQAAFHFMTRVGVYAEAVRALIKPVPIAMRFFAPKTRLRSLYALWYALLEFVFVCFIQSTIV